MVELRGPGPETDLQGGYGYTLCACSGPASAEDGISTYIPIPWLWTMQYLRESESAVWRYISPANDTYLFLLNVIGLSLLFIEI